MKKITISGHLAINQKMHFCPYLFETFSVHPKSSSILTTFDRPYSAARNKGVRPYNLMCK